MQQPAQWASLECTYSFIGLLYMEFLYFVLVKIYAEFLTILLSTLALHSSCGFSHKIIYGIPNRQSIL
jgi:hypothetical protein